jgi:hypothetical protein
MAQNSVVAQGYRGFVGSLWGSHSTVPGFCALEGDDHLTLVFSPEAADYLRSRGQDPVMRDHVNALFSPFGILVELDPSPRTLNWTIEAHSPWPIDGQNLLTSRGLKHTLRRVSPGHWSFDFPGPSLKKDWVKSLESFEEKGTWRHRLIPGSKWDWRIFLEEGFVYPPEGGQSRVRLTATEGSPQLH